MQRHFKKQNEVGMFEWAIWILAGITFIAALTGLFRYLKGQDGLFTFITGGGLFALLMVIRREYHKRVVLLQTFMLNLPLDMWMSDKDGLYILQSGESRRLMGNIIGKRPEDLGLPSELLAEWKTNAKRVLNGETIYKEGKRIVDGKTQNIFTILNPVKSGDDLVGSVGINLNITERKKIERQMRRSAEHLAMLNEIARAITTLDDLDSVLNLIRSQAQRLLPVDAFMVLLYQPETNMVTYPLVYDNGRNWPEPAKELTLDMKSNEILKTGRSLLLNLTNEEVANRAKNKNRSLVGDYTTTYRSFIYVPLVGQQGVIGVIAAISYQFNTYNHKHLELLESFALQATIAIENAHLYQAQQKELAERKQAEQETLKLNAELEEHVRRRTTQLQEANLSLNFEKARLEIYNHQRGVMADMTNMLQASLKAQEAAEIVSKHLKKLFPQNDGALYLLNETEILEPVAVWGSQPSLNAVYAANDCWGLRRGKPYRYDGESLNPPCGHLGEYHPRLAVCIPLMAQGESLGNLHISANGENAQDVMNDEEQRFIETVVDSIALALANLRLREKLHLQSIRDALTGLYNRRYLDETLPREIHRARRGKNPLSILLFDIDHFKKFNDTHGHDAGDFVLQTVSQTTLSVIRESDIACRHGGEEFIIILPDTPIEAAQKRADALRQVISSHEMFFKETPLGKITVSVGVAAYPQHGEEKDALVKSADEAMYRAKENGRNRVVVSA